ncbi:RNA polymerase sigma factor [Hominibacterium faecale]|uniref:RNA polymerase sigma factor n=1 Tax=Hominibacterium faecale TaxID=2839743 RepID=UPI0022B2A7B9|nr:sigma factor-like helix-turn-helix DNA-binding protein [Hominibacterium faecale]
MTKERLKKLRALLKEAEHLKENISRPASPNRMVIDTILDGSMGRPRPQHIGGLGQENYAELRYKYWNKLHAIQSEITELEQWLDGVEDPQTRDILRLQYINGLTQEEIAEELGYSVRTIKRKLHSFWKDGL